MKKSIKNAFLLFLLQFTLSFAAEEVQERDPNPDNLLGLLKDARLTKMSEEIASKKAFRSVIQLELFCTQSNAHISHSHIRTGLIIHPAGILSCAHGLNRDLIQDVEEMNSEIFKAKLKYPLYIHSNPNKEFDKKYRSKNCSLETFVYFSKTVLDKMKKKCPHLSASKSHFKEILANDFAFFHIDITKDLCPRVVDFKKINETIYTNKFPDFSGYPTCSFYTDQNGNKKLFFVIEQKYPLGTLTNDLRHHAYLTNIIDPIQCSLDYPALLEASHGCSGSPVFLKTNTGVMLLGLLNASSNDCNYRINGELKKNLKGNLITPIRKLDLSSGALTAEMADTFKILYETFSEDMEREYPYSWREDL